MHLKFNFLCPQLSELEQRVLEAEGRADEAEDKVRIMKEQSYSYARYGLTWTTLLNFRTCSKVPEAKKNFFCVISIDSVFQFLP